MKIQAYGNYGSMTRGKGDSKNFDGVPSDLTDRERMRMTKSQENDLYGKDIDSDVESINCCQLNVHKAKIREDRSKYHNNPEKEFYSKRSCTDVLFLLLFIACLGAWLYLGYFAIKAAAPFEGIFAPTDSRNRRCGYDAGVLDKPNVFYFDILKCVPPKASVLQCNTPRVCVSECPKENFYLKVFLDSADINVIRSKLICQDGFNKANIYNKQTAIRAIENKDCAEWYLESKPIGNRCLPKSLKSTANEITIAFRSLGRRIESTINGITGKELFEASKALTDIFEFGHAVFEDLTKVWAWILIHVCVAAVVSFIYITIMRWISGIMVWLSVFSSIGLLVYSSYYTWVKFQEISKEEREVEPTDLKYSLVGLLYKKETWLGFFIVSIICLAIILLTITFLRSRISLAIELITEGSKAVTSSWSAVIFPIFPWIIQIACVAYAVLIFAYLLNSGVPTNKVMGLNNTNCICRNDYREGSVCDVETFNKECRMVHTNAPCTNAGCFYSDNETQEKTIYLHLYNLFMFLWSLFFASGYGQMVLASTFSTYYWTFNKNDLPLFMVASSVWRVIRYHLGTVSLGSFLLALCNWIRILIELWYNYLNKYENNFVKFLRCCCACFFWILNTFLKFLNKNAYVMCAIHGKNFCISARLAFDLLLRNVLRVAILDRVTNFLFFLGKVMVTTALGVLSFHFFSHPVPPIDDPFKGEKYVVEYYFVPMLIICIVTYFIASLFFGVYSMAVDTIFLCALEDLETNDGSPEKPYFMSKNLMKILKKKNQIKVNK